MTASARTHRDTELSADVRAGLLLREMTPEEKCGRLSGAWPWTFVDADGSDADGVDTLLRCPPGHVPALAGDDPARLVRLVGAIQHRFATRTRLGVPALIHQEALNGFMTGGHMVFPTPVGLAATFSPDLVEEMSDLIRGQMRRLGFVQALSPVMDVALDPAGDASTRRTGRTPTSAPRSPSRTPADSRATTSRAVSSPPPSTSSATASRRAGSTCPPTKAARG